MQAKGNKKTKNKVTFRFYYRNKQECSLGQTPKTEPTVEQKLLLFPFGKFSVIPGPLKIKHAKMLIVTANYNCLTQQLLVANTNNITLLSHYV